MICPISYRISNKILLLFLILFISSSLSATEKSIKDSSEANFFSVGVGLMYQFTLSHLNGNTYYALRHFGQFNPLAGLASNITPGNYEFGLLYGKAIPFNTKNIGFIALSTGLSYVHLVREGEVISYEHYKKKEIHTIGIPLELQLTKSFTQSSTYGFSITANLNRECIFFGIFLNLGFGDFKNYRPNPPEQVKSFQIKETSEVKIKKLKKTKLKLINNYSIELNTTRPIIFLLWREVAIKTGFTFNRILYDLDLIIPVYYRYSASETVLENEISLFTIDAQLRKFF
jgi:hypothetical protein